MKGQSHSSPPPGRPLGPGSGKQGKGFAPGRYRPVLLLWFRKILLAGVEQEWPGVMIRLSGLQARELTGLPLSFLAYRWDFGLKPYFAVEETETQKGFHSRSHNTGVAASKPVPVTLERFVCLSGQLVSQLGLLGESPQA